MFDVATRSINPAALDEQTLSVSAMAAPDGNTFTQYAGLGNMQRLEQPAGTNLPLGIGGGTRDGRARSNADDLRNTISQLLGDNIQLNMTRAVDLDATYQSAPMAAVGLGVAVSGRATIVNADVASHLAEFQVRPEVLGYRLLSWCPANPRPRIQLKRYSGWPCIATRGSSSSVALSRAARPRSSRSARRAAP